METSYGSKKTIELISLVCIYSVVSDTNLVDRFGVSFENCTRVYNIFLSMFGISSVLDYVLSMYMLYQCSTRYEVYYGTVYYMYSIILYPALINGISILVNGILSKVLWGPLAYQMMYGVYPMVFFFITLDCLQHSEQVYQFCCLPIDMKAKYLPYLLLLTTAFFNTSYFVSVLLGYLHSM